MKRCICISIRGFNLDESPEYHRVYQLRDEAGDEFSDMLEIHVVELNKTLKGTDGMDGWIRLFNAETEEELEMLETGTNNMGILEAIIEVRIMSLRKYLRLLHEARLKEIRDMDACEDYVRREAGMRDTVRATARPRIDSIVCTVVSLLTSALKILRDLSRIKNTASRYTGNMEFNGRSCFKSR